MLLIYGKHITHYREKIIWKCIREKGRKEKKRTYKWVQLIVYIYSNELRLSIVEEEDFRHREEGIPV